MQLEVQQLMNISTRCASVRKIHGKPDRNIPQETREHSLNRWGNAERTNGAINRVWKGVTIPERFHIGSYRKILLS
jgi:hypothetical protein